VRRVAITATSLVVIDGLLMEQPALPSSRPRKWIHDAAMTRRQGPRQLGVV
jgi:hypothetical protein